MEQNNRSEVVFEFTSHGLEETDELGALIAGVAQRGDVVSLEGPLGAGKTRLVQGIARALGADGDQVTSPTFVILNEYRSGRLALFHFDVYRLRDEDEFWQLGPEEYFDGEGMSLLEWGDRVVPLLPPRTSRIAIDVTGDSERVYRVTGPLAERLLP
jgi:tRNA threonylcarbamoyladenosine biosynthesis protein TsaE